MNRSDKITVLCGSVCEALAAYLFFAVVTQFIAQGYGASGATIPALKIGQILFGVYGYTSVLAPLFLAVSGVLLFIGKATLRAGVYVAASLVPFVTTVFTEKIARYFLANDTSSLTPFKVAAVIVVCALVVAIEYVFIGMLADFIATKQQESEAENAGEDGRNAEVDGDADDKDRTGKKARRKNEESEDDDIPETAFSVDTDFGYDEEESGNETADSAFEDEAETDANQDDSPFAIKPRKINGVHAVNAANGGKTASQNEAQNGEDTFAQTGDGEQNAAPKKKNGMSTFTIPQFIPYNEQIAQKDVVWKDYETIGDYVRKSPHAHGVPSGETADGDASFDESYGDESADFDDDTDVADGFTGADSVTKAVRGAENADAVGAPGAVNTETAVEAEEAPIFVNFKRMNVPDLAEAIDRAKAESEYAHHARRLETARRLRESVAHEISPFSPLAQNTATQNSASDVNNANGVAQSEQNERSGALQNGFAQRDDDDDSAFFTDEATLEDVTDSPFDKAAFDGNGNGGDFGYGTNGARDELTGATPKDAADETDDIFDDEESAELEDLISDDEAAFLENPFEDEDIAEDATDEDLAAEETDDIDSDEDGEENAPFDVDLDEEATDEEHEAAIDEAIAEAKAAIGKQPYAPVKPLSFDDMANIEPIFESDVTDEEKSPVTVESVLGEAAGTDADTDSPDTDTNSDADAARAAFVTEESTIDIPIVFDDEEESAANVDDNEDETAPNANTEQSTRDDEHGGARAEANTAEMLPRSSGLLSAASGIHPGQNESPNGAPIDATAPDTNQIAPNGVAFSESQNGQSLEQQSAHARQNSLAGGNRAFVADDGSALTQKAAPIAENAGPRLNNGTADAKDGAQSIDREASPQTQNNSVVSRWKKPYLVPAEGLLNTYPDGQYWVIDDETQHAADVLKQTLSEFKIEADVTGIRKGPVITMFEILPAPGVKLARIVALQDNIALRLAASSVRIVAPIPGKHAVGIEVPNKERSIVSFKELVDNDSPLFKKMEIPVVLGKDITGEAKLLDLAATPHLLIAGSTGSGKSVCVNTMILSILYKRSPDQVKMILIDPKIVELKLYNDIPHLLTPVITEPKKAFQVLQYCLCEMERRYAMLDHMGVRDIKSYNRRIDERKIANEKLPYIVIIIDEFADLMATTGKELESMVARLAAMSRAVGIHLVLATQRPSIDVITGLIKANIPTRIAFMVASKTDSRIIIDQVGAEKLLGKGDMLYASAVDPFPVRIQGTFVSEEEVEKVVEYVKGFGEPEYIDEEIFFDEDEDEGKSTLFSDGEDPLYEKALEIVLQEGKASASYIQRRLKIGYNRAARLVEEMEERGIVGPANGSKPRDVLHVPSRAPQLSQALAAEAEAEEAETEAFE